MTITLDDQWKSVIRDNRNYEIKAHALLQLSTKKEIDEMLIELNETDVNVLAMVLRYLEYAKQTSDFKDKLKAFSTDRFEETVKNVLNFFKKLHCSDEDIVQFKKESEFQQFQDFLNTNVFDNDKHKVNVKKLTNLFVDVSTDADPSNLNHYLICFLREMLAKGPGDTWFQRGNTVINALKSKKLSLQQRVYVLQHIEMLVDFDGILNALCPTSPVEEAHECRTNILNQISFVHLQRLLNNDVPGQQKTMRENALKHRFEQNKSIIAQIFQDLVKAAEIMKEEADGKLKRIQGSHSFDLTSDSNSAIDTINHKWNASPAQVSQTPARVHPTVESNLPLQTARTAPLSSEHMQHSLATEVIEAHRPQHTPLLRDTSPDLRPGSNTPARKRPQVSETSDRGHPAVKTTLPLRTALTAAVSPRNRQHSLASSQVLGGLGAQVADLSPSRREENTNDDSSQNRGDQASIRPRLQSPYRMSEERPTQTLHNSLRSSGIQQSAVAPLQSLHMDTRRTGSSSFESLEHQSQQQPDRSSMSSIPTGAGYRSDTDYELVDRMSKPSKVNSRPEPSKRSEARYMPYRHPGRRDFEWYRNKFKTVDTFGRLGGITI